MIVIDSHGEEYEVPSVTVDEMEIEIPRTLNMQALYRSGRVMALFMTKKDVGMWFKDYDPIQLSRCIESTEFTFRVVPVRVTIELEEEAKKEKKK